MTGLIEITATEKDTIFVEVGNLLAQQGFTLERLDFDRPWGGFFVINEEQAGQFIETYFPDESLADLAGGRKISPKILVVAPKKRLSWQYHHRRSEVWRVVNGRTGVITSDTDEQGEVQELELGDKVVLACGERHRLVGLEGFGLVAEIWQHTDPDHPSDEDDIVRLADDFGRG